MEKNAIISEKYKADSSISQIPMKHNIKVHLEFTQHYMNIQFIIPNNNKQKLNNLISHFFTPFYTVKDCHFYINYSFLRQIAFIDQSSLIISVFNPMSLTEIFIQLRNIEIIGLIFNKKTNTDQLNRLRNKLSFLIQKETKNLIEELVLFFSLLRTCLTTERSKNDSIEDSLICSYNEAKDYYDKCISELKRNFKLKRKKQKEINKRFKNRTGISKGLTGALGANNPSNFYKNGDIIEDMEYEEEEYFEDCLDTFPSFHSLLNDFKLRTSLEIEETVMLFFRILSIDETSVKINLFDVDLKKASNNLHLLNEREKFQRKHLNKIIPSNSNQHNASFDFNLKFRYSSNDFGLDNINLNNVSCDLIRGNIYGIGNNLNSLGINENKKNSLNLSGCLSNNLSQKYSNESTQTGSFEKRNKRQVRVFERNININPKDNLETPKFNFKNENKNNSNTKNMLPFQNIKNSSDENNITKNIDMDKDKFNFLEINKMVEESKKSHSYVPTNCTYNIFYNTSEIIHRKFFQNLFDKFIANIFIYEKDQTGVIKLHSLYSFFIYIRGLKNMLFIEKNRGYFSNNMIYSTRENNL
ncbi:MAG: hypothetical protein MJ252_15895 [archaeon]|nr:hypothetical protein [archaeon]